MIDNIRDTMAASVTVMSLEEVLMAIEKKHMTIIDVRRDEEVVNGIIPTSIHMPLSVIQEAPEKVKQFNGPVLFYCKAGGRALKAAELAQQQGVEALYYKGSFDEFSTQCKDKVELPQRPQ